MFLSRPRSYPSRSQRDGDCYKKEKGSSPPATAAKDVSREETEIIPGLEIITRQGVIAEIVNDLVFSRQWMGRFAGRDT